MWDFCLPLNRFESVLEDGTSRLLPGQYTILLTDRGPLEIQAKIQVSLS